MKEFSMDELRTKLQDVISQGRNMRENYPVTTQSVAQLAVLSSIMILKRKIEKERRNIFAQVAYDAYRGKFADADVAIKELAKGGFFKEEDIKNLEDDYER